MSQDSFQTFKFNKFPMIKPREIETVPKEEHKAILDPNDEPSYQWLPFKEEIQYIIFF